MLEMTHARQGIAGTPTDRTFEKWDVQNDHYIAYDSVGQRRDGQRGMLLHQQEEALL
jgi:hypothetical protein